MSAKAEGIERIGGIEEEDDKAYYWHFSCIKCACPWENPRQHRWDWEGEEGINTI
jgi:hypothetical protein